MQATSLHRSRTDATSAPPRKTYARLIGALFIIGFLAYGTGFGVINSVITAPDFPANISGVQNILLIGAFLMLLNTVVDIGKGVLFFPILEHHGRRTAFVYLAAIVVQVVFLDIGALFLLMLVPLSQIAADAGASSATWAPGIAALLTESNTLAYNVGQATLSFGGFFLCLLLYRTRLIPQLLAGLGVVGYVLHAAGAVSEIFGLQISLYLLIPGMFFEIGIALWLIVKGFEPGAVERGAHAPDDAPAAGLVPAPVGAPS